jgi:hypothetical protein
MADTSRVLLTGGDGEYYYQQSEIENVTAVYSNIKYAFK